MAGLPLFSFGRPLVRSPASFSLSSTSSVVASDDSESSSEISELSRSILGLNSPSPFSDRLLSVTPISQLSGNERVEDLFSRIMTGSERLSRIQELMSAGSLSEEEKLKIIGNSKLRFSMKESLLLEIFMSLKEPVNESDISYYIQNEKNLEILFFYCWNNGLSLSFGKIPTQPILEKLTPFIRSELEKGITVKKVEMISYFIPCFKESMTSFLFSILETLADSERQKPEYIALGEAFFFDYSICQYLKGAEYSEPKIDHLKNAFKFYWSVKTSLKSDQVVMMQTIAEKIYLTDLDFVDVYVRDHLERSEKSLHSSFIAVLDCLSLGTMEVIDCIIAKMMNKGGDFEFEANEFIEFTKRRSLVAWKYGYDVDFRNYTWMAKGTQIGKDGRYDFMEAFNVILSLNKNNQLIQFNIDKTATKLAGGVCSAMVFNFLKLYLEKRASLEPKEALNAIAHAFSIATGQFRATQAAYNTLYKNGKTADFNKDKIEALLRYENPKLSVINHSKEINLNVEGVDEVLMSYLNTAPDGVFVVRSLRPLLTEEELDGEPYEIDDPEFLKGEQYGHSTLWIKSKGENFYYDPAVGIIQIHDLRQLPMILQWEHYRWTLPNVRFYQVS